MNHYDLETGGRRSKKVVVAACSMIGIAVIGMFSLRSCDADGVEQSAHELNSPSISVLEMDENAEQGGLVYRDKDEIQKELNQKVEEGMINISMNTSPIFADGTAEGNLLIVNSEANNYPQIVYIIRKDTGDEIYRSKGIAVGSKIECAKLSVNLPAGVYDCVAYFSNVDPNTGSILGTAGAEITITVQN